MVKNLPEMWETHAPFLGQEDPLEKGMATHSSILAQRVPWTESLAGYSQQCAKSWTQVKQLSIHAHGRNHSV